MSIIIDNDIVIRDGEFYAYDHLLRRRSPDGAVMLLKVTAWGDIPVKWTYTSGHVYRNKRTDDVFIASRTGEIQFRKYEISASDWRYDRTEITKPPSGKPSLKTAKLSGSTLSVSVSVASSLVDSHSNSRATGIEYKAIISIAAGSGSGGSGASGGSGKTLESKVYSSSIASSVSINLQSAKKASGKDLIDWANTTEVGKVAIAVRLKNKNGTGPWVSAGVTVKAPDKPKLSAPTQNADTGKVSTTLTVPKSSDKSPVRETHHKITLYDSRTNRVIRTVKGTATANKTLETDLTGRMAITQKDYLKVTFEANAYGVGGKTSAKEATYYGAIPNAPSLSLQSKGERVTFRVKINKSGTHPVTGVRLYALVSSSYDKASDIPLNASWQAVGPTDNGSCSAISVPAGDLLPDAGTYTWVRLKAWNDVESVFYCYSQPLRVSHLETPAPITPSATGDKVYILSHNILPSGTECEVTFGWLSNDTADRTEVSWSDNENAWRSTNQPETFTMVDDEWDEGPSGSYGSSTTLVISDLKQGKPYYVSARRALKPEEGEMSYGEYCSKLKVDLSSQSVAPTSVTLVPSKARYPEGEDLLVSWDYGSSEDSEAWKLMQATGGTPSDADRTIASGTDLRRQYTIPWSVNGADVLPELAGGGSTQLYVIVQVAGVTLTSGIVEVSSVARPTAEVEVEEVTALPATISVSTDTDGASASLLVTAQGVTWDEPDGLHEQAEGEFVWAWRGIPDWQESEETEGTYEATVEMPSGVSLIDGGGYVATLTTTNDGVSSSDATCEFDVNLARKAPAPSSDIVAEGHDVTDESGVRTLGATVTLVEPTGYDAGDVYDVYRVSNEVATPVAVGVALDAVIEDTYAPFGSNTEYRVACRTDEGSVSWLAATYALIERSVTEPKFCRVDWHGGYVELERGVVSSDSYSKPFETREHMDGSTSGHWGPTIARSLTVSAQLIREVDTTAITALRKLARHDGPCYLRTSDGVAMACDVQVSLSSSLGSARVDVSIKATEVLSGDYGVTVS